MGNIFLTLEKEVFRGNVLDITYGNDGVIYHANKYYDSYIEVDYIENKLLKEAQVEEYYDSCILFFSLNKIKSSKLRKELFSNIYNKIRKNGYVYIYDIQKKRFNITKINIEILLPDKKLKKIKINSYNIFSDITTEKIINDLNMHFDIIESISSNGAIKIIGRKKGC
ncbi:MAG: class I SAM-dependent methyltransferase [Clostridium sp.]|uniref:class I SAM-dependent methyltransferase n=1 Tax=Clostridium sp. TaxID=1506 RepID=UPI00303FF663